MHERNKNKMQREGVQGIKGVQKLEKKDWAKIEREARYWALEDKPNQSGSSEPDRFSIIIYRPKTVFLVIF